MISIYAAKVREKYYISKYYRHFFSPFFTPMHYKLQITVLKVCRVVVVSVGAVVKV